MMHGARICPRCRARVDERRARGALYCLSCGAPLGTPPPISTRKPGGGSSVGLWIALGLALLVFVGAGITGAVLWLGSAAEDPAPVKKKKGPDAPPLETAPPTPASKPKK